MNAKPKRTGPKLEHGEYMQRLCGGGPWVHADVLRVLHAWRECHGVPIGRGISAAVRFAAKSPNFKIQTGRKLK